MSNSSNLFPFPHRMETLALSELRPFRNNPFKPYNNRKITELAENIKTNGFKNFIVVRSEPNTNGCEIISGHARVEASKLAGLNKIRAAIVEMSDTEALIYLIKSNFSERKKLLPSELASSFKILSEHNSLDIELAELAISKSTVKIDDEKSSKDKIRVEITDEEEVIIYSSEKIETDELKEFLIESLEKLCSLNQGIRDIYLEHEYPIEIALNFSSLNEKHQEYLLKIMNRYGYFPTLEQSLQLKDRADKNTLNYSSMLNILNLKL